MDYRLLLGVVAINAAIQLVVFVNSVTQPDFFWEITYDMSVDGSILTKESKRLRHEREKLLAFAKVLGGTIMTEG